MCILNLQPGALLVILILINLILRRCPIWWMLCFRSPELGLVPPCLAYFYSQVSWPWNSLKILMLKGHSSTLFSYFSFSPFQFLPSPNFNMESFVFPVPLLSQLPWLNHLNCFLSSLIVPQTGSVLPARQNWKLQMFPFIFAVICMLEDSMGDRNGSHRRCIGSELSQQYFPLVSCSPH